MSMNIYRTLGWKWEDIWTKRSVGQDFFRVKNNQHQGHVGLLLRSKWEQKKGKRIAAIKNVRVFKADLVIKGVL